MKISKFLVLVAVVFATVACGKIPEGYRGNFQDKNAGVKLTLGDSDGTITFSNGRTVKASVADLSFDALVQGKSGLYIRNNPQDASMYDVYWLNPDISTKQAEEGMVWYQAEVIWMLFGIQQKDKVPNIQFAHCAQGVVELDTNNKTMMMPGGCGAGQDDYNALRM